MLIQNPHTHSPIDNTNANFQNDRRIFQRAITPLQSACLMCVKHLFCVSSATNDMRRRGHSLKVITQTGKIGNRTFAPCFTKLSGLIKVRTVHEFTLSMVMSWIIFVIDRQAVGAEMELLWCSEGTTKQRSFDSQLL